MKTSQHIAKYLGSFIVAAGLSSAQAAVIDWDNGGAGTNWTTDNNWNPDTAPAVPANNGDTINIGALLSVDYDVTAFSGNLPNSATLNVDGTLDVTATVMRFNNSDIFVGSTGTLTGNFYDMGGGSITFADGATASMNFLEVRGSSTLTFQMGASDFDAGGLLNPNNFLFAGGNDFSNLEVIVDFANYSGLEQTGITLIEFGSDPASATTANFAALAAKGFTSIKSYGNSSIYYDEVNRAIMLDVAVSAPEPSTLGLVFLGGLALNAARRRRA